MRTIFLFVAIPPRVSLSNGVDFKLYNLGDAIVSQKLSFSFGRCCIIVGNIVASKDYFLFLF